MDPTLRRLLLLGTAGVLVLVWTIAGRNVHRYIYYRLYCWVEIWAPASGARITAGGACTALIFANFLGVFLSTHALFKMDLSNLAFVVKGSGRALVNVCAVAAALLIDRWGRGVVKEQRRDDRPIGLGNERADIFVALYLLFSFALVAVPFVAIAVAK